MRYIKNVPSIEGGYSRCGTRTPMQWNKEKNAGFSSANSDKLYLPIDPSETRPDVDSQEKDEHSLLSNVKKLIEVKRNSKDLAADAAITKLKLEKSNGIIAFQRGNSTCCIFNLTSENQTNVMIDKKINKCDVLLKTEDCEASISEKQLELTMKPYSYIIIKSKDAN
jgi:maltose alpha-D-glucosyltransferase/alpha-amylase